MSFRPNKTEIEQRKDMALFSWRDSDEHSKKTFSSLDALIKVVPKEEEDDDPIGVIKDISEHYGFKVYAGREKDAGIFGLYVAYDCGKCEKIVVGPPIVSTNRATRRSQVLTWYCGSCSGDLKAKVGMRS